MAHCPALLSFLPPGNFPASVVVRLGHAAGSSQRTRREAERACADSTWRGRGAVWVLRMAEPGSLDPRGAVRSPARRRLRMGVQCEQETNLLFWVQRL